jgi:dTMP kinase
VSDPVQSGRLITVEGGEGAGKSTVLAVIERGLREAGIAFRTTREPGGTAVGEACRAILLDSPLSLCAESELLLMFASRAQLVREHIQPSLARGEWVLSDRFTDASYAYQGGGRGLPAARIAELERWAVGIRPDLTFLLDVGVDRGMARMRSRGEPPDRIEQEQLTFFHRVRDAYLARARREPGRFRVIDANQPVETVAESVSTALSDWLQGARR